MANVLKDFKCEKCKSDNSTVIRSYKDEETNKTLVNNAVCNICGKTTILPDEEYIPFVYKYGEKVVLEDSLWFDSRYS